VIGAAVVEFVEDDDGPMNWMRTLAHSSLMDVVVIAAADENAQQFEAVAFVEDRCSQEAV
jgi:Tfp pilus assembly protein PilN